MRLKQSGADVWLEAKHQAQWVSFGRYVYLTDGAFWVYTDNADGSVDMRVIF